jgi:hypothetical protein
MTRVYSWFEENFSPPTYIFRYINYNALTEIPLPTIQNLPIIELNLTANTKCPTFNNRNTYPGYSLRFKIEADAKPV